VLGGDITSGSAIRDASWHGYAFGGLLLLAYLAADGWTSTQQEVLYKTHATPIREQLLYTTAFSSVYSLAACVASGQLLHAAGFLLRHPDAALAVFTLSLASTIIQVGWTEWSVWWR
jgi:adenosine 3'-phospho 5'-phosphosulfate transporter B2